jgi:DNA-binding transcriptional LysR family regulator
MLVPEEVETYLAVVRAGSFQGGAEVVNATQSTVSHRISGLEQRLGHRLILRSRGGRGINLTSEGRTFKAIAERWEALQWETRELKENGDLRLTFGASNAVASFLLPPLYERASALSNKFALNVETGRSLDLADRVSMGHLQMAFILFREERADLDALRIIRSPMMVALTDPTPAQATQATLRLEDLDPQREVTMKWGADNSVWRRKYGLDHARIVSESAIMLPPLLRHTGAWSIVPEFMIDGLQKVTKCHVFGLKPVPPPVNVFRIMRKENRASASPEIRQLNKLLQEIWPRWFSSYSD